jgi:hypothetical protein
MALKDVRGLDLGSAIVCSCVLALVLLTVRSYGIAWDEQGENVYGELLIRFYTSGFTDRSAFEFVNFRFYGGGFELPAALLARVLPWSAYEARHLLSALVGIAALVATSRAARKLGGARAGLLAALLLAFNPCWYGHTFINARDVPLAAGIMGCLWLSLRMLDELPRVRARTALAYGAVLGWMISVRVGAVIAVAFLGVLLGLWLGARARAGLSARELSALTLQIARSLAPALPAALALIALLWPWALLAPGHALEALQMFSRFPFEGTVLFQGEVLRATALPSIYVPVYLAVTQPEALLAGVTLAVALALHSVRRARALGPRAIGIATVACSALAPVAYFVLARPVAYNSMRHFLFVVPLLTVLAALAFDHVIEHASWRSVRGATLALLGALLLLHASDLVRLHGNQYLFFNRLVGGVRGAQGRYELDYWGTSLREATERLVAELERRGERPAAGTAFKAYVCGNVYSASEYFPRWIEPVDRREDADFHIAIASYYCGDSPSRRNIIEATRAGATLSIVEDQRPSR